MKNKKYLIALGIVSLVAGTAFASSYVTKQNIEANKQNGIQVAQAYTDNMPPSMHKRYGTPNTYNNINSAAGNSGSTSSNSALPWQNQNSTANNLKTGSNQYNTQARVPAQQQQPQQPTANSGCNNNNILGTLAGGVLGGLAGNQIGKGKGKTVATIGGAVAGAAAGNQLIPLQNTACPNN